MAKRGSQSKKREADLNKQGRDKVIEDRENSQSDIISKFVAELKSLELGISKNSNKFQYEFFL